MIRTPTTMQAEKYVHSLKCLDVWRGLKRTKHKSKTEKRTYITVSVYLSGSVYFCCVLKGNLSSDLGSKICLHRGSWVFICQRFTQRASETSSMLSAVIDKNSEISVCFWRVCLGLIPWCRELSRWDKSQPVYFTWENLFLNHFLSCFPVKTSLKLLLM